MRSYAPLVLHYFFTAFACAAAGTKMFDGEYHKIWHDENIFHPEKSMTFQLIRKDGVELRYLDKTHLSGFDGQDIVSIGPYSVEHRLALITSCNKPICVQVDGILGFGNMYHDRNPSLLDTLTRQERADWDIVQAPDFMPIPRRFAFTATEERGEIQLGGYDPLSLAPGEQMLYFPAIHDDYNVKVKSIKYGNGPDAIELLNWSEEALASGEGAVNGRLDSGTSCILLPSSDLGGKLTDVPYDMVTEQELNKVQRSLFFTMEDQDGHDRTIEIEYEECVQGTPNQLLFGDPLFRRYVIDHDFRVKERPLIGIARRADTYNLDEEVDEDYLESFSGEEHDTPFADSGEPAGQRNPANPWENTDIDEVEAGLGAATKGSGKDAALLDRWREVGDDAGPPLALLPLGVPRKQAAKKHELVGNWRKENAWGAGKQTAKRFPAKIGARRKLASEDESQQLMSLVHAPTPGLEKVRLQGRRVIYTIPVGIGTPAQMKNVIFDTGSYMLAVWSASPSKAEEQDSKIHQAVGASTAGQMIKASPSDPNSAWTMELLQARSAGAGRGQAGWVAAVGFGAAVSLLVALAMVLFRGRRQHRGEQTPILGPA